MNLDVALPGCPALVPFCGCQKDFAGAFVFWAAVRLGQVPELFHGEEPCAGFESSPAGCLFGLADSSRHGVS